MCPGKREAHGKAQRMWESAKEFQRTHGQTTRHIFRQIFVFCVRALCIEIQKGGYSSREINGRATQQRPRSWIDQQRASRCIGHCRLKPQGPPPDASTEPSCSRVFSILTHAPSIVDSTALVSRPCGSSRCLFQSRAAISSNIGRRLSFASFRAFAK